jgi:hypothetical protein
MAVPENTVGADVSIFLLATILKSSKLCPHMIQRPQFMGILRQIEGGWLRPTNHISGAPVGERA